VNGFAGALDFSISLTMYLLRFVLAALVLWLVIGGIKETTRSALLREKDARPGGRVS
jgi:hypothetical protein